MEPKNIREHLVNLEQVCETDLAPVESSLRMIWTGLQDCLRYDERLSQSLFAADIYRMMQRSVHDLEHARETIQNSCGVIYDLVYEENEAVR